LARIKKIMKIEDEVKNQMISGEGPILVAKASEFLIEELTLRAWLHAESHRRKTLQKNDIGNATLQNDMFDFLIDIVPREESSSGHAKRTTGQSSAAAASAAAQQSQQPPAGQQQPQQPPQMGPPDYTGMQHPGMQGPGEEYGRGPPQAMYAGHMQGPPDPSQGGYGQPQPFMGEMYAPYGHLGGQQQVGNLDPQ